MSIPPIQHGQLYPLSGENPQQNALLETQRLLEALDEMLSGVQNQNMDMISKALPIVDSAVDQLQSIMDRHPGDFTPTEKEILTGGNGLLHEKAILDGLFTNDYPNIGTYAGVLFGLATSLQINLKAHM